MEPNGVWKNAHGLAPLSPTNITHKLHHNHQEQEEQKEAEYMKKMKFNSTANWLGLADNTCCNHYCTTDNTSVSLPPASFASTRRIDHPILQLHPYHNHHHHRHQQLLPEMAIAKSSLPWQLGSNMRGQDNQSRINLAHDGRESLINFVSTVDGAGGGEAHKWYNNTPEDEWATRAALRSNHHMGDPTSGFLTYNNMQQSFMNYTGNNSNNNNTAVIKKGGGSSSSNNKDRHSKVFTSKGVRDRRIRLAVSTATQFYDIQDRLGYEQPSKAVDWLMSKARASIDELPRMETHSTPLSRQCTASLEPPRATIKPNCDPSHQYVRGTDQFQDIINGNPHAVEDEHQVLKVVSGVEMSLADEPAPNRSVPYIWGGIDLAAAASFSSSSLPCNGMQLREHSLKRCRSNKHS